jgi:hypothetical protein
MLEQLGAMNWLGEPKIAFPVKNVGRGSYAGITGFRSKLAF